MERVDCHYLAQKGSTARLQEYLNQDPGGLEALDSHGRTMLLCAVKGDSLETLKFLVELGANARATDRSGSTVLHVAAENNSMECAHFLLNFLDLKDLLKNRTDSLRRTPLNIAEKKSNKELAKLFREMSVDREATLAQPSNQRPTRLEYVNPTCTESEWFLVKDKATVEKAKLSEELEAHRKKMDLTKLSSRNSVTLIHEAIKYNDLDRVRQIVLTGESLDMMRDTFGKTPIMRAVWHDNVKVLEMLIAAGANPFARDWGGETSLHKGSEKYSTDCVRILLERFHFPPEFVNARSNILHNTALHLASARGNKEIVYLLLQHGADVNAVNINGETPHSLACSKGRSELGDYLAHVASKYTHTYQPMLRTRAPPSCDTSLTRMISPSLRSRPDDALSSPSSLSTSADESLPEPGSAVDPRRRWGSPASSADEDRGEAHADTNPGATASAFELSCNWEVVDPARDLEGYVAPRCHVRQRDESWRWRRYIINM